MPNAPTSNANDFFNHPIINSPYKCPDKHWELDADRRPTRHILPKRRSADFLTPIPRARQGNQGALPTETEEIRNKNSKETAELINKIRHDVSQWRKLPKSEWQVTPTTATLLEYWRKHKFEKFQPFFCQIEAAEIVIWLTEVAPKSQESKKYLEKLHKVNEESDPDLFRIALKLATGAGKTTVMAMLIAWQTLNAVQNERQNQKNSQFTKGFLVVSPGITIKDRLRVLQPNDPESYYQERELVPQKMMPALNQARVVITNYHAFRLRDSTELSSGTRSVLEGWRQEEVNTRESEGAMLRRVMGDLLALKSPILVINDEAHHCYREKDLLIAPDSEDFVTPEAEFAHLKGAEKTEAKNEARENTKAARVWISGLDMLKRQLKVDLLHVIDLSATPFFLSGSGYQEGTIFPWTVSDFSLMDAIECGIVKLPRVPVSSNIPEDSPMYRDLWEHIRAKMPKKGRTTGLDPLALPPELETAIEALYEHYEATFNAWQKNGNSVPPCFIFVCNNTSTSKLIYDYVSGYWTQGEAFQNGRLPLFRNFDEHGHPFARPHTILIDSKQLDSGEALEPSFLDAAKDEIAQYKKDVLLRGGPLATEIQKNDKVSDAMLLREVMNTVGKEGKLGGDIRCVVSVSMLTEGWDARNVTHILGIRAFGTQLLCEQVVGRALRRMSYDKLDNGFFAVEYSDVLGIPFDFTAKPVVNPPKPDVHEDISVNALPERADLEIVFPNVVGYRTEFPTENLHAQFNKESFLTLTPELTGATEVTNAGIIGKPAELNVKDLAKVRTNTILMHLTRHLLESKFRDDDGVPQWYLFGQLKKLVKQWFTSYFRCIGSTYPAQLMYRMIANLACERIAAAISRAFSETRPIQALLDPYNPEGSTRHVHFTISKKRINSLKETYKSHVNYAVMDSKWEEEFCDLAEKHEKVVAYVKNYSLGFTVPYSMGGEQHDYLPDFIVLVDDGHGKDDLLHFVVEVKGYRGEDAVRKKETMDTYWIPGVNRLKTYGRWAFVELCHIYEMRTEFDNALETLAM